MADTITNYLRELRRGLRWHPVLARRAAAEVADHLAEAVAAGMREGLSREDSEAAAIGRFGPSSVVARRYLQVASSLAPIVITASVATACVALWLAFVSFTLRGHDETTLLVWRGLATMFMAYSVLSVLVASTGGGRPSLQWTVALLSIGAIALGSVHVVSILFMPPGGHFEDYVLIIGLVLAGHGLVTLAHVFRSGVELNLPTPE
jgi:cation transport ATPase